ncbi:hypothetical protein Aperf_G00000021643 [Anoplocephala perfoliata]
MSSDDEVYFDAPEEVEEAELTSINLPSTTEHECIRNRIESLKKSARKFERPSPISPYLHFDSIESASAVAPILEPEDFNRISSNIATSRLLSRTFPEKGSFPLNSRPDYIQSSYKNNLEGYPHVRSDTVQPLCFSPPILSPILYGRSTQPMSSAPEVNLRPRHHPSREDYVKSWSLDATRCQPQLLFPNDHRPSLIVSPRAPQPMEPLLDRSEGSEIESLLVVSRVAALEGGVNCSEEMLTVLPFPFSSFSIPSHSHITDKFASSLQSQNQTQMDACVQASITEVTGLGGGRKPSSNVMTDPILGIHQDLEGFQSTLMRVKAAAATLPGTGNSSMNPMSLDYRTRTLSVSSLRNNGSLDKLEVDRNGSHLNQNFKSGIRKLHTAFRGAVSAVRSATKAKIFNQDEPSSEEDDEVIGNQGIRLRCSRKMKGHKEFLQIKLVQKLDNEHIGAIWAMRASPCGRLLATAGYDRNIRIWVLRRWYNHYRNMLQTTGEDASATLGSGLIDDLDIDSVSMTSISLSTRVDDGGSSCSSSGLFDTASVSVRSRGEISPPELFLGNSAGDSRRRGAASGSILYHPHPLLVYRGHEGVITELAWSKNLFLLSTGMDRQVRLWHISRRECLCAFSHNDTVPAIVFHPKDDRYFLSGSLDGKLRLWNIPDKKVRFWVDVPLPSCLPSFNSASSSSRSGVGGAWSGGSCGNVGIEPKTIITCATFACDSTKVVVGSYDGRVMFFNTELTYITFITVKSVTGRCQQCRVTAIEVDPTDSNKILVTSNDSRVYLIDARDYHTLCKYRGFLNETSQIRASFSSSGRYIISGSENCFFYIWRKQMDFLNISRFSSTRKDRNNCWEAIKAHDAVVTVALFLPTSESFLIDPHRQHSRRQHMRRPGVEYIVSADCNGCLRVFRNRAPVSPTVASSKQEAHPNS